MRAMWSALAALTIALAMGSVAGQAFTYPTNPDTCSGSPVVDPDYSLEVLLGEYSAVTTYAEDAGINSTCTGIAQAQLGMCINDLEIAEGCCSAGCAGSLKKEGVMECFNQIADGLCAIETSGQAEVGNLKRFLFNTARRCVTGTYYQCKGAATASPPPTVASPPPKVASPPPKVSSPPPVIVKTDASPPPKKDKASPPPKKADTKGSKPPPKKSSSKGSKSPPKKSSSKGSSKKKASSPPPKKSGRRMAA